MSQVFTHLSDNVFFILLGVLDQQEEKKQETPINTRISFPDYFCFGTDHLIYSSHLVFICISRETNYYI